MSHTCKTCLKDKPLDCFTITRTYKGTVYRDWKKCKECRNGHEAGFAGKINADEKKRLLAADFENTPLTRICSQCMETMKYASFYRYWQKGMITEFLKSAKIPAEEVKA